MKTNYHKRQQKIIHGSDIKHSNNPTGILVDMLIRTLKYNIIKIKRKNGN
tara:strand:+ start:78 stop:227 length:150 start_codon:yes stop_codon:yes gene_type:complete